MPSEEENIIDYLIEMGIIIPLGYSDELGQEMYRVTDAAEEMFPEFFAEQMRELNETIFDLWNLDLIDIVFDDGGEPLVGLNKNSTDKEKIEAIENKELRGAMYGILLAFVDKFGKDV